jgi:hypothetical protein
MKILGEIQDAVNEINSTDIASPEVGEVLKNLLESTRWRFVDIASRAWLRGALTVHLIYQLITYPNFGVFV